METIAAISTAPGLGGIGIIRITGDKAFEILLKIFKNTKVKKIEDIVPNTIIYGKIYDDSRMVDEVLVSFFKSPNSYTKEDLVEINTHGGSIVMKEILNLVLKKGAMLAEPGEFTKRAFLNGRIDLTQVESIATILNAKSEEELRISGELLQGKLYNKVVNIKERLIDILMHLEVNIDYPEYDTDEKETEEIVSTITDILKDLKRFEATFDVGSKIKDGIKVSIIGRPNAGKSSLLNNLLNKERAIVTEIEGTTRDSIEEDLNINGINIKIIDTAGIRETDEKVEKIGIERAITIAEKSDLIIAIFDISKPFNENDRKILDIISKKESLILLNKYDLVKDIELPEEIKNTGKEYIYTSMLEKKGTEDVIEWINKKTESLKINKNNDIIIIHERQKKVITDVIEMIEQILKDLEIIPIDMVSENIRDVINKINELTGENVKEEVLNEIFKNFCLGK
ncbi:MAG: tRNA uridine-5-carboxymethylaminomethyl(34) synthesis GTPase MnmE [Clostridiales bacterium]|nr:tRNA uridine-5-carboxymethylaminomethyl(34) synthesis GTPase MnmE [Clostridiales bacterium]